MKEYDGLNTFVNYIILGIFTDILTEEKAKIFFFILLTVTMKYLDYFYPYSHAPLKLFQISALQNLTYINICKLY